MTVRRRTAGTIAVVSALGMTATLGGCGSTGSSDTTLRLVAADYGDSAAHSSAHYWKRLADAYHARHPDVTVDVSVYSWNDVDREVRRMVAAGHAPDLAQIGSYADYAAAGKLYEVSDLLSIRTQADFVAQLADAGRWKYAQYGIPFAASTRVLFYNKTLFADAGLTPPADWSQLASDAAVLKSRGVKFPYALPLGPEEAQAETMQWMLSGGGNGYTDDIGTYTIDSPQNVNTFDWLRDDLVGKGLTGPVAPGRLDRADAFSAFADGQVGMLDGHPALMRQAAAKGVKFGTVPAPGRTGRAKAAMGVTDWMTGFRQNGHAAQIGGFLDFVYDRKNVLDFSRAYGMLPVTSSASQAMTDSPTAADRQLRPFLDQLSDSRTYPVGKTSWASVSADVKKDIGQAVAPGGSPATVLGRLQATAAADDSADQG